MEQRVEKSEVSFFLVCLRSFISGSTDLTNQTMKKLVQRSALKLVFRESHFWVLCLKAASLCSTSVRYDASRCVGDKNSRKKN